MDEHNVSRAADQCGQFHGSTRYRRCIVQGKLWFYPINNYYLFDFFCQKYKVLDVVTVRVITWHNKLLNLWLNLLKKYTYEHSRDVRSYRKNSRFIKNRLIKWIFMHVVTMGNAIADHHKSLTSDHKNTTHALYWAHERELNVCLFWLITFC